LSPDIAAREIRDVEPIIRSSPVSTSVGAWVRSNSTAMGSDTWPACTWAARQDGIRTITVEPEN
jgi:hypothetical protein